LGLALAGDGAVGAGLLRPAVHDGEVNVIKIQSVTRATPVSYKVRRTRRGEVGECHDEGEVWEGLSAKKMKFDFETIHFAAV